MNASTLPLLGSTCSSDDELRQCIDELSGVNVADYKRSDLVACVQVNLDRLAKLELAGDDELRADFRHAAEQLLLPVQRRSWSRLPILALYCAVNAVISTTIAYSNESIKQRYDVKLPLLVSLIMSLNFILGFLIYAGAWLSRAKDVAVQSSPPIPVAQRLRAYAVFGGIDAIHVLLQANALNALPASIYTLLKGSGIIFTVVLSKLIVRKRFLIWHWIAVSLMVVATAGCALLKGADSKTPSSSSSSSGEFLAGFAFTLSSAFLVSLLSVLQQKLLRRIKHSSSSFDDIAEANLGQALFAFPIIAIFALSMAESSEWIPIWRQLMADGHLLGYASYMVAILLSRSLSIFAAMGVTSFSSAMFSRSFNAMRQSAQIIFLSLIFSEGFSRSKIFGMVFSVIAFFFYIYGGHRLQQQKGTAEPIGVVVCRK